MGRVIIWAIYTFLHQFSSIPQSFGNFGSCLAKLGLNRISKKPVGCPLETQYELPNVSFFHWFTVLFLSLIKECRQAIYFPRHLSNVVITSAEKTSFG